MNTVCQHDQCTGCMACIEVCPKDAITISDSLHAYNAEIDPTKCVGCDHCHKICQNNQTVELTKPIKWYQGWAEDEAVRKGGSSGGAASALMQAFVKTGGYVCSCLFRDGSFVFKTTNEISELKQFCGSKYVKSDPRGAYRAVRELLSKGERVLFIGLPCQVAALKLFVGERLQENLFTADLICHGTPSPQLLELFLQQYGYELKGIYALRFRLGSTYQLLIDSRAITAVGASDSYSISFLKGISLTENCYSCKYARLERVSDITLGDSWGTELSGEEIRTGISLLLCQTEKGVQLVKVAGLKLTDVDLDRAVARNAQLKAPMPRPAARDKFFQKIKSGKKYNKVIFKLYPKQSIKQWVKKILIKAHLYGGG